MTEGKPGQIETIALAPIAVGADDLFIETHPHPAGAKSNGTNIRHLNKLKITQKRLTLLRQAANQL